MTDNAESAEVELTGDDPEDIDEVYAELRGVPGITVAAVPAHAGRAKRCP
jgi:hypothetical protein